LGMGGACKLGHFLGNRLGNCVAGKVKDDKKDMISCQTAKARTPETFKM